MLVVSPSYLGGERCAQPLDKDTFNNLGDINIDIKDDNNNND